jgi:hypothetical protein
MVKIWRRLRHIACKYGGSAIQNGLLNHHFLEQLHPFKPVLEGFGAVVNFYLNETVTLLFSAFGKLFLTSQSSTVVLWLPRGNLPKAA